MENLKESIHKEFQAINFDDWKVGAQKTLKNVDLDNALSKHLTENISINSIYDLDQVQRYFDLDINSNESNYDNSISIDSITELPSESDIEVAVLLDTISRNNYTKISVSVRIDSNFFLTIAKFRAIRYLLSNIENLEFNIVAESSNFNKSVTDIENNLIRLTTEVMSAIIGGVDKVNIESYNSLKQNDDFGRRITDNILVLLENESYLKHVEDPLSGSYLIENLTNEFIKSVKSYNDELERFENVDSRNDFIIEKCTEYNKNILTNLDSQKKKLVGVNIYQNKKDRIGNDTIDENRIISSFEAMKTKVDNINPKVYIANLEEQTGLQTQITIALNTYNIPFQISGVFELVEDAFNSIKLYDPDLVIVNGNDDIMRILGNMLTEYKLLKIDEFSDNSILKNVGLIVDKLSVGE